MSRVLTLIFAAALSGVFSTLVPLDTFLDTLSQITTLLSIMIAAVLVRLNRGMPAIDWKDVEAA